MNHCCKAYRSHRQGSKKVTIGFVGLEDDFKLCERIFLYAYDCIVSRCREIRREYESEYGGSIIRQMGNAYGEGFCEGLKEAYEEQNTEHQEYALVLVTPKQVLDAMSYMEKGGGYGKANYEGWRAQFGAMGYKDGQEFDPSTKLGS
jgi:hypothetical protein